MRITGGIARGIPLKTVSYAGFRPAMDMTRQSLFSSLQGLGDIEGSRALDLFAGSGAYGLEAVSRGAARVTWVEKDRRAVDCIRQNLEAVKKSGQTLAACRTEINARDVMQWQGEAGGWDLIFCDPPYESACDQMDQLWEDLAGWLNPQSAFGVCWEAPGEYENKLPAGWELLRRLGGKKRQPAMFVLRPVRSV